MTVAEMTARHDASLSLGLTQPSAARAPAVNRMAAGARGLKMILDEPDLFGPPPVDVSSIPADVVLKFEELAFDVANRGYAKYSARTILHRIRWHYAIERGDREFKCNDHWSPPLARWFMQRHPKHADFFELRVSQYERTA